MERRPIEKPDISEKGGLRDGQPQRLDRRLFMQLLAFTGCGDLAPLTESLSAAGVEGVLYEDVADPRGVALLTYHENPDHFVGPVRAVLRREAFASLTPRPELTMFGRTYSLGYEPDLEEWLLKRPRKVAWNPAWPWAVWYPLRRKGAFSRLPDEQQRSILMEHGVLGRSFGEADFGHDIRLACFGMDRHDNDFVIGLVGKELYPLSALVQAMRKTVQTSEYIEKLGPFFVGKAAWRGGG